MAPFHVYISDVGCAHVTGGLSLNVSQWGLVTTGAWIRVPLTKVCGCCNRLWELALTFLILFTHKTATGFPLSPHYSRGAQILDLVWVIRSGLLHLIIVIAVNTQNFLFSSYWETGFNPICQITELSQIDVVLYYFNITFKNFYSLNGLKQGASLKGWNVMQRVWCTGPSQGCAGVGS